jgi:hypothetical protein
LLSQVSIPIRQPIFAAGMMDEYQFNQLVGRLWIKRKQDIYRCGKYENTQQ